MLLSSSYNENTLTTLNRNYYKDWNFIVWWVTWVSWVSAVGSKWGLNETNRRREFQARGGLQVMSPTGRAGVRNLGQWLQNVVKCSQLSQVFSLFCVRCVNSPPQSSVFSLSLRPYPYPPPLPPPPHSPPRSCPSSPLTAPSSLFSVSLGLFRRFLMTRLSSSGGGGGVGWGRNLCQISF